MTETRKKSILLVEDDPNVRFAVSQFLTKSGFSVDAKASCADAEKRFRDAVPSAVVLDNFLPDGTGIELLAKLRLIDPSVPIVLLTAHHSYEMAMKVAKLGAASFLPKPLEMKDLRSVLEGLTSQQNGHSQEITTRIQRQVVVNPFLGISEQIQRLSEQARLVARSDSPVLIQGETGAGKGVLARWLHAHSSRHNESFLDLNCAVLAHELLESELFGHEKGSFTSAVTSKAGLFEVADRGTLFLDEIGDLDLRTQPKLLKAVEEKSFRRLGQVWDKKVDVRLIAATHQDLAQAVGRGTFRADLFFRLETLSLVVPALRERPEDIPIIADVLMSDIYVRLGRSKAELTQSAILELKRHHWPGNVRELRNVLERAILLNPDVSFVDAAHLNFSQAQGTERLDLVQRSMREARPSSRLSGNPRDWPTLEQVETDYVKQVLAAVGGSVKEASKILGIPRSSLYYRLRQKRTPDQQCG